MADAGLIKEIAHLEIAKARLEKARDKQERGGVRHGRMAIAVTRLEEALFWVTKAHETPCAEGDE